MLYEVSQAKGNQLNVYICRNTAEISDAIFECGHRAMIPEAAIMFSAFSVGRHLSEALPETLEFMGIQCRNLPEEEYEKWQKAF